MKRIAILVVCLVVCFLAAPTTHAKPPKVVAGAAACGLKAMPFAVNNSWTWKAGNQEVTLKVTEVAPGKDWSGKPATVITVEELYQGRVIKNQLTCTPAGGLVVPLESILFTGEPGGGVATTFTVKDRDSVTFPPDAQLTDGFGWVEKVKAEVIRADAGGAGAKHAPGAVEIERHVHLEGANNEVLTTLAQWKNTQKIVFELRGRGEVGTEKVEIPIKRPGAYYLVKGLGFVKIEDAFDKTWELVQTSLIK